MVREHIYQSLDELDAYLGKMQHSHGSECVHKNYTREQIFKDEVRFMHAAPQGRYERYREETMTIQYNLHVSVGGTYYSAPYTAYLADKFVKVRIYPERIEIYQNDVLIAQHRRTSDRYSTVRSHMLPPDVLDRLPWNGRRLREWAAGIGPETYRVIDGIISRHPIEQQCYVTCVSILSQDRDGGLEDICRTIDDRSVLSAYRIIRTIIQKTKEKK